MAKIQLKNHVIICGYGIVGQGVAEVLDEHKQPFVVIDISDNLANKMKELGYDFIQGDATLSRVLRQANIENAKVVVFSIDNDAKNLFGVLTARDLNKNIFIVTRANDDFVKEKLDEAGANYIVMPHKTASKEIVKELLKGK